jgi:transcription elongation factor S-II
MLAHIAMFSLAPLQHLWNITSFLSGQRLTQKQATRAGVFVGKLRSNPNKDIARAASELVAKWKKLVEQEKNSKLHKSKIGSPAPAPASSPAAAPAASAGGAKKTFKGDPEKRRYDADGVDIKRTDSTVRNQCIGLIYNGLAFRSTESESDVISRAVAVENAAFVHFKGEGPEYKKKIRSLFANLKNKTNKELGRRVMSNDITAERFVIMTDEDLKSEDQRKMEIELEKENMKKAQVPMAEKSISDSLECSRCKKKKVSYTQAQTRSADEPMTTFCECMNCGNRWKVCDPPLISTCLAAELTFQPSSFRKEFYVWRFIFARPEVSAFQWVSSWVWTRDEEFLGKREHTVVRGIKVCDSGVSYSLLPKSYEAISKRQPWLCRLIEGSILEFPGLPCVCSTAHRLGFSTPNHYPVTALWVSPTLQRGPAQCRLLALVPNP